MVEQLGLLASVNQSIDEPEFINHSGDVESQRRREQSGSKVVTTTTFVARRQR